jgi:hypothetical protein
MDDLTAAIVPVVRELGVLLQTLQWRTQPWVRTYASAASAHLIAVGVASGAHYPAEDVIRGHPGWSMKLAKMQVCW